jgi:hypothetical protein
VQHVEAARIRSTMQGTRHAPVFCAEALRSPHRQAAADERCIVENVSRVASSEHESVR